MKHILYAFLFVFMITNNAFAEDTESFCKHVSIYAEKVMHTRQQGVPLSNLIKAANGSSLFEAIIVNAYEYPKYENRSNIGTIVCEFRDKWYVVCMGQMGNNKE